MALNINDFPYAVSFDLTLADLGAEENTVKIIKDKTVLNAAKYLEAFLFVKSLGSSMTIGGPNTLSALFALDYSTAEGWLKEFDLYLANVEE